MRFRTSLITICKDLEWLHHQGLLERTHGGALPMRTGALQDQSLREKERQHRLEKLRIASAAVRMIRPDRSSFSTPAQPLRLLLAAVAIFGILPSLQTAQISLLNWPTLV
jgi:DeoR/GlpR family transcriptional regulator of sugar metabolism